MKAALIGLVLLIVLSGGAVALHMHMGSKNVASKSPKTTSSAIKQPATPSSAPASNASPAATATASGTATTSTSTPAPSSTAPGPLNVTVTANDDSASPETITASKGQTVHLTFNVSTNGTYHGGLDFKNSDLGLDSGSIAEGSSKTMTFMATKSFKFTPYWYQSDVQKDYFVTVNVN